MAMETVLEKLENKINELLSRHQALGEENNRLEKRVSELQAELEKLKAESHEELTHRTRELEEQRMALASRLENTITLIDRALAPHGGEEESE